MYCGITIVVREAIQVAALGQVKNWIKIAGSAAQSGNYQEAYEFYTRVLEVDGDNSDAWLGRAEASGRLSTVANSRLLEMITGIKKALDSATTEGRTDIEKRSGRIVCSVVPTYYNSVRAQIIPHLFDGASNIEYIAQIHKVAQTLDAAYLALPKHAEIGNLYLQLCRENLNRIAFRNTRTGQTNYWRMPQDQRQWLQGRWDYYSRELMSLNPQSSPKTESKAGLIGLMEGLKLPKQVWIGLAAGAVVIGVLLLSLIAVGVQESERLKEDRRLANVASPSTSPSPNSRPSVPVPNPVDSAGSLKRGKGLLTGSPAKEAILQAKESLSQIPPSSPEYKEAQKILGAIPARLKQVEIPALREAVRKDYEEMLTEANPHLNSINTKLVKNGKTLTLYGVHTYFSQYSFKIGSLGPTVSEWIAKNRLRLEEAGIGRVGVMGDGEFASWAWFQL